MEKIPVDVPAAAHPAYPADKPPVAWHECAEMSVNYYDTAGLGDPPLQGKLNPKWQSIVRRAYCECGGHLSSPRIETCAAAGFLDAENTAFAPRRLHLVRRFADRRRD